MNPRSGDSVTITGTSGPSESISFSSSFEMALPTESGAFEFLADGVEIPQKPNRFSVTARNVKDLSVGVKMGIWLTKGFPASSGTAFVSHSDIPPGRYTLKVFGSALDESSPVKVEIDAGTSVTADSQGKYSMTIDTTGIPSGDYKIVGAGDTKIIKIGGSQGSSTSSGSVGSSKAGSSMSSSSGYGSGSSSSSSARSVSRPITPDVIRWYLNSTGLNPADPDAYSNAESALKVRLKDGYWILIAKGDPLTEQAGTCKDSYCIVRGSGACTTCKEKDVLASPTKGSPDNGSGKEANVENVGSENASAGNATASEPVPDAPIVSVSRHGEGGTGLLDWIMNSIRELFGLFFK